MLGPTLRNAVPSSASFGGALSIFFVHSLKYATPQSSAMPAKLTKICIR